VIREYYGHMSAAYSLALHPTLDVLASGSRDSTVRIWDMRTKIAIHVLGGHNGTVTSLASQGSDPQFISGSADTTIRLWDLAKGGVQSVLTHHKKSVRSVAIHPHEYTMVSGAADNIKQWKFPEGKFLKNFAGHRTIVNSVSVNTDNVLVSCGNNGSLYFWDWKSGYNFQQLQVPPQSGSLDSEAGILCSTFDQTGTRLITGECDKTIKFFKENLNATPKSHPVQDFIPNRD